jgi:hypothetical protein
VDYKTLADGIEKLRETLRAMVAGIMAEGFTEEQARDITVAVLTNKGESE